MDFWEKKDTKMSTEKTKLHAHMFYIRRGLLALSIVLAAIMSIVCVLIMRADQNNAACGIDSAKRIVSISVFGQHVIGIALDSLIKIKDLSIATMWAAWTVPLFVGAVAWLILPGKTFDRLTITQDIEIKPLMSLCIVFGGIVGMILAAADPGHSEGNMVFFATPSMLLSALLGAVSMIIMKVIQHIDRNHNHEGRTTTNGVLRGIYAISFYIAIVILGLTRGIVAAVVVSISILLGTFITILVVAIARKGWKFVFPPQFAKTEEATK